jgi:hypothetical protein
MGHMHFDEPVAILVGMGLPVRIEDVTQAYVLLRDWPAAERNGTHAVPLMHARRALLAKSTWTPCALPWSRSPVATAY